MVGTTTLDMNLFSDTIREFHNVLTVCPIMSTLPDVRDAGGFKTRIAGGQQAFSVGSECSWQKFDSDTASKLRVGGLIDVAHTPRSQVTRYLVMCELRPNHEVM